MVSSESTLQRSGLHNQNEIVAQSHKAPAFTPAGRTIMRATRSNNNNNNKATQAFPGIHTLAANLMARIWNAANDLQNVATLGVAKPVARKWARNLLDS
jgi:peroxiredoxin